MSIDRIGQAKNAHQLAEALDIPRSVVYRNPRAFGGVRIGTRWWFFDHLVEEALRSQAGGQNAAMEERQEGEESALRSGDDRGGKEKTKRCKTWEEAQRWEIAEKDKAKHLQKLIRTDCLTLHKLLSDYLTNVKSKVVTKTYNEKRLAVKRMLRDIPPESPVSDVTFGMVEDHLDRVYKEVSGHRANKSRKNIIRAYNWGIRRRLVPAHCKVSQ